jgi:hypothetical protein
VPLPLTALVMAHAVVSASRLFLFLAQAIPQDRQASWD